MLTSFLIASVAILSVSVTSVFAQSNTTKFGDTPEFDNLVQGLESSIPGFKYSEPDDIMVLSHHFETGGLPGIVGEVQNNSTRSYEKYDVDIVANFRDSTGELISSETGYIDAETLSPGDSSAFQITSFDESLPDTATTYDLVVEDERVVQGASLSGDDEEEESNDDEN
jgi:hypothetical protein